MITFRQDSCHTPKGSGAGPWRAPGGSPHCLDSLSRGKVKETHQEAYRAFRQCSIIEREQVASSSKPKIREMQEKLYDRTDSHLNRFHKYFKDYPGCEVFDFWTWDSRINPTPFEG